MSDPHASSFDSPFLDETPTTLARELHEDREHGGEAWDEGEALELGYEHEASADVGLSTVAVIDTKLWPEKRNRSASWQGNVFGLVVHTTGSGLPEKARKRRESATAYAVRYYKESSGSHYVNGWGGIEDGQLIQVANERFRAWGVSFKKQKATRLDDLPPTVVRHWRRRWRGKSHPRELMPGGRTWVNDLYVHCECPPCVWWGDDKRHEGATPMRPGLRFTKAQHDAVARLAIDVAQRNGWPLDETWWRSPRLVGHEDLSPVTRSVESGGWDPGYLRDKPHFEWDYVYEQIEALTGSSIKRAVTTVTSVAGKLADGFKTLVKLGQERAALELAYSRGTLSENDLTNLVFYARNPHLEGHKIRRDQRDLARQWVSIRNGVVRPFLAAKGTDRETPWTDPGEGLTIEDEFYETPTVRESEEALDDPDFGESSVWSAPGTSFDVEPEVVGEIEIDAERSANEQIAIYEAKLRHAVTTMKPIFGIPFVPHGHNEDDWDERVDSRFGKMLVLRPNRTPFDALERIVHNSEDWHLDCAYFVQVAHLYALSQAKPDDFGDRWDREFKLRFHHSDGVKYKYWFKRWRNDPSAWNAKVRGKWKRFPKWTTSRILKNMPLGSRIMWANDAIPEGASHSYRYENAVKVDNDSYRAFPLGRGASLNGRTIALKMAKAWRGGNPANPSAAMQRFTDDHIYIRAAQRFRRP